MEREAALSELKDIATEAIVANATGFGEIQSSFRGLNNWYRENYRNAVSCNQTIMAWHRRTGATEAESVSKLCDILEQGMIGQMDWFDSLGEMILHWCSELKDTDEYRRYEKSKSSSDDLMPLLRKGSLVAVRRIIEEFSAEDFSQMFSSIRESPDLIITPSRSDI